MNLLCSCLGLPVGCDDRLAAPGSARDPGDFKLLCDGTLLATKTRCARKCQQAQSTLSGGPAGHLRLLSLLVVSIHRPPQSSHFGVWQPSTRTFLSPPYGPCSIVSYSRSCPRAGPCGQNNVAWSTAGQPGTALVLATLSQQAMCVWSDAEPLEATPCPHLLFTA